MIETRLGVIARVAVSLHIESILLVVVDRILAQKKKKRKIIGAILIANCIQKNLNLRKEIKMESGRD